MTCSLFCETKFETLTDAFRCGLKESFLPTIILKSFIVLSLRNRLPVT